MHTIELAEEQRTEEEKEKGKKPSPMQKASRQEVAYHTRSAPEAQPPAIDPFPPGIVHGLWLGITLGALAGLLTGNLLFQGILPVEGWEGLFSMTPFTFHAFWVFAGAATGLFIGGLAAIIATPTSAIAENEAPNQ